MTPSSLEQSFLALIEFLMLSKRRVIELGAECGLTGMQTMMLFLLHVPRPMGEFTHIFNCDASNITGLVDGLEQKDLVRRRASPDDRRVKTVELTGEGKQVRRALVTKLTSRRSPILDTLSDNEYQTFIGLLQKITQEK